MYTHILARTENAAYSPTDVTATLKGDDEPSGIAIESVVDANGEVDWVALEVDHQGNRWFTPLELDHLGYTEYHPEKSAETVDTPSGKLYNI